MGKGNKKRTTKGNNEINIIINFLKTIIYRVHSVPGIINLSGDFTMLAITAMVLIKTLSDYVLEMGVRIINMILVLCSSEKEITLQDDSNSLLIALVCIILTFIEVTFCSFIIYRNDIMKNKIAKEDEYTQDDFNNELVHLK